jgi:hypothetical protein
MRWVVIVAMACLLGCGARGYASPAGLDRQGRGAASCSERCAADGMRMAGMVHIDRRSACVCETVPAMPGGVLMSGAASALETVLEEEAEQQAAAARRR